MSNHNYKYKIEVPRVNKHLDVWEVVGASEEEALQNWKSGAAKFRYSLPDPENSEAYGAPVLKPIDPPNCACDICHE